MLLVAAGLSACASDPAMTGMALAALAGSTPTSSSFGLGIDGRYDCATLTPEKAQLLLDQGHTYLDPEHDNIACGTLTITDATQAKANAAAAALTASHHAVSYSPSLHGAGATSYSSKKAVAGTYSGKHYRCADLTSTQAQALLAQGHSYLDLDGDGDACEPDARRDYSPRSSGSCHWVKGYTRKDGTKVRGHQRCR